MSDQRKPSTDTAADISTLPRDFLEQEVLRLREMVSAMQRGATVDAVSGVLNRSAFLDQANAEFARSRRYGHALTLCITDIVGLARIVREHGDHAGNQVVMAVTQMCTSSSRFGVDVLGRISENQIAVMLPETTLEGGVAFLNRMRDIVAKNPILLDSGERVRPGLKVSADCLNDADDCFADLFQRTWRRTDANKKTAA